MHDGWMEVNGILDRWKGALLGGNAVERVGVWGCGQNLGDLGSVQLRSGMLIRRMLWRIGDHGV